MVYNVKVYIVHSTQLSPFYVESRSYSYSYHIAIFSLCEAIVKSILNKTPGDGGEYEEKAYATQHYVKSILC
jgi:hypothetical protein